MIAMHRIATALALTATCLSASAVSVLAQTPQGSYTTNVLGGSAWDTFTATLTAQHALTRTADFSSLSQLQSYAAVWVDQELGNSLDAAEISALQSYIGSGHKAVLIGENYAWSAWNPSIMSVVGGSYVGDCSWAFGTPSVAHALTAGITSVQSACGSTIGAAGAPQVLFSNGMAALYKVGSGEALVILDSNGNDDVYSNVDNPVFPENVAGSYEETSLGSSWYSPQKIFHVAYPESGSSEIEKSPYGTVLSHCA